MIIQSIRLKNIKSYGEGAEGKGVMILFAPGVNGIAGKNGHGKTTLVESLGYTLFLSKPQSEENLDLDTFFLRAGAKAGEIDVTFSHAGEVFRVERGIGPQSKRRTKVVQVDDGSICAEGEQAVAQFLCKTLACPHAERLAEMFSKLIGVKQGRLAWPFDSKPKEAKDFFEPLLEVAVFRECFERLKPAVDEFSELRHKKELVLAGLVQSIRERQDSPELVASKRIAASALEKQVGLLTEALEAAKKSKEQLEGKEAAIKEKERQFEAARHAEGLAAQRQKDTEQRVEESLKATETLGKASPSYQAFKATETALKSLRTRQAEQQRLERDKAEAVRKKTELEGTLQVVRARAEGFVEQKAAKEKELAALRGELKLLRRHLEQTRPQFEARKTASGRASENFTRLRHFVEGLPEILLHQESELRKIQVLSGEITGWDAAALENVRQAEAKADQMLEVAREEVAGAKKRHDTLAEQLKEISGGFCPFLKEKCQQFDPAKVGTDLQQLATATQASEKKLGPLIAAQQAARGQREKLQQQEAALGQKRSQLEDLTGEFVRRLARLCPDDISGSAQFLQQWSEGIPMFPKTPGPFADGAAEKALEQAFGENRGFSNSVAVWWPKASEQVQTKIKAFQSEEQARLKEEQNQGFQVAQEIRLAKEIDKLQLDEKAQRATAHDLEAKVGAGAKALGALDAQLEPFSTVNDEIAKQEQNLETHRAGYLQYLEANPLASQLPERQTLLTTRREDESKAAAAAKECEAELTAKRKEFEPRALFEAQKSFLEKNGQVEGQRANLTNAKEELKREEKRFAEWQAFCTEREKLDGEVTRLKAAMELTEFARKTLRDSAPAVAQHLCNRIAARAQQIFNKINHEPVELNWDAIRYSLRISPGERHFAMLSGGEQTKLALAMTLALIQEFSALRFAVFDEPTYAVDADSRERLAKAILEAQKEAGLEQLIIVSHDDAFEGELENVVLLRKTAQGTEQAGQPGFEMTG